MILKRLTLVDSIRFLYVCSNWKRVSSQWLHQATRLPWVFKSARFLDSETVSYSLYSPSEDTIYCVKFPSASRTSTEITCSGSIHGWLIMSEGTKQQRPCNDITTIYYFLNPMTGDRISLPLLTGSIPWFSSASQDPTSSDCIVAFARMSLLWFCRPSSRESWVPEGQRYTLIADLKFHEDGKLYVLECNHGMEYQIHVLVIERGPCDGKHIVCKEKTIEVGCASADRMDDRVVYGAPSITWSSKGEIFVAFRRRIPKEHDKLPEFPIICVLKTDDTSNCKPIWVNKTNNIGQDQVLLISDSDTTLISKPKSFMPILDESFFALHSGKIFIHDWKGVCFKPSMPRCSL